MSLSVASHWPRISAAGKATEEGEPEDLTGRPRTVFGVKTMCGLILQLLIPGLPQTGDFFIGEAGYGERHPEASSIL